MAIPSYDRVDVLKRKTLQLLLSGGVSANRIYVFVDPDQFQAYQEALEAKGPFKGLHVVKGRKGICNQRNAIMEHFKAGDRVVEMDDDIQCLLTFSGAIRNDRTAKSVPVPNESFEFIIDHMWEIADREKCKLWGIYPTSNFLNQSRTYTVGLAKSTGQMQGYYNPGRTDVRCNLIQLVVLCTVYQKNAMFVLYLLHTSPHSSEAFHFFSRT